MQSLTVAFASTRALDDVSLTWEPARVHGVIGENGAGKSTLMRVLAGLQKPTAGRVHLHGQPLPASPAAAIRMGVAMIHQELNLIDELSIADNIFLGRERSRCGFVRVKQTRDEAVALLQTVGCELAPQTKVKHLSIAQKQMVEIAKALRGSAKLIIMDEPTAVLTSREAALLFKLIHKLRESRVTVVYISHLLPEMLDICDTITVLRDGRKVATLAGADVESATPSQLAGLMVGRPMADHFPPRKPASAEPFFSVRRLSSPGKGTNLIHDVSFDVRRGEIFGFAGLIGAGRTELAESIVGLRPRVVERIMLDGKPVHIRSLRQAIHAGIGYLPEDRKGAGLTLGMNITANITMAALKTFGRCFLRQGAERRAAERHAAALHLKFGRLGDTVDTLSGGNQQKVVLAKWLETEPRLLIVDEPTRGVDIGARESIYRRLQAIVDAGVACIVISSEINELIGLCHRIAVMRQGRIAAVLDATTTTESQVMHHAAGVSSPTQEDAAA